jgi:hypothetical protein
MEFKLPFDSPLELQIQDLICNKPYPPMSERYSQSLRKVVGGMLTKVCLLSCHDEIKNNFILFAYNI